jgi:hypothetical protein
MESNNGIINKGTFTSTIASAGDNNTITTTTYQHADLQQLGALFTILFDKLQEPGEEVANKAEILEAITVLKEEIKKPEPKKSILKMLGKSVLDNLSCIKTLAPIAQSIWHHISSFIGAGS